jgi:hypothetical protein
VKRGAERDFPLKLVRPAARPSPPSLHATSRITFEPGQNAPSGNRKLSREQSVEPDRNRIHEVDLHADEVVAREQRAFDGVGNGTLDADAQTRDRGKVEGAPPRLTGIVVPEAVERFRPDSFGCRALDDLATPRVVTLAATIDELDVDATLWAFTRNFSLDRKNRFSSQRLQRRKTRGDSIARRIH